jgi:predicted DCC family thiol-disulfide oxidoreductase YuxK
MYPYSDGSPVYEFGVASLLLVMFGAIGLTPAHRQIDGLIGWIAAGLRRTGLFSSTITLSAEAHRLDLLRIVIGVMSTWHYEPEFAAAIAVHDQHGIIWFGLTVAASACLTIGFLTPIAALALLLGLNILVVNFTLDLSIGSLAIAMFMIPMVIAPAGHTLSVDAVLLRFRGPVRALYAAWGRPTVDRIQLGRFLALVAYASIDIYSALNHLGAQTWRDGLTTGTILLFPTIDPRFYGVANWVYAQAPALYVAFSKFSTFGMLVWQLLLIPLALASRWTRIGAIIWGFIFFAFSAHVLAIKTLGVYEYFLFVLVFWSHAWIDERGRHSLMIFFDDRCNLCDRTVKTLAFLDLFHRLEFRPLSQNVELARQHGVSEREALTDLVGVGPTGKVYRGYGLYQRISAIVLLTLPLWPVLFLGRMLWIGPALYRFIADRRTRIFGVCTLGAYRARPEWEPAVSRGSQTAPGAVLLTFVVLLGTFVFRMPIISRVMPQFSATSASVFGRAPLVFGMGFIDVFNEADLKLYHASVWTAFVDSNGQTHRMDPHFSETMNGVLTQDLRVAIRESVYCSETWGDHIARFFAETLPPDDPYRTMSIRTEFSVATHPSRDDLLSFRYAPLTWEPTCTTTASIADPSIRTAVYSSGTAASAGPNAKTLLR